MVKQLIPAWLLVVSAVIFVVSARTEPFILGADISWIDQRESEGVKYADNGTVKDMFLILKEHKFNWIRLRLFVDPTAKITGESESPYSAKGFCDLDHTIAMAKRAKNAGFRLLLDFHYSDTWADPAKQYKPVSWSGLSFSQLKEMVRSYTKETLEEFSDAGVMPDMVQVGNEVVGGMIWPDGKSGTMANFAALVNAGIDGVKDVSDSCMIMIHSISENSPNAWLSALIRAGVTRIDVFGLSYYSKWHGTPAEMKTRVLEVAKNQQVKIAIAEYADNHREVNDIIFNLPDEKGIGTFCWEPGEWMDALFDWKNNRRETNGNIDLYPVMSKDYGNDAIVSVKVSRPKCVQIPVASGDEGLTATVPAAGVFDLQGRVVEVRGGKTPGSRAPAGSSVYISVENDGTLRSRCGIQMK